MKGIDCATPLTAQLAQQLAASGIDFVVRYLVPQRYAWKRLTKAEVESIKTAGLQLASVFETSASRPAGGAAAGGVDGQEAYNEAVLIGQPLGSAIYFAVDYDAQPKDYDAIEQYLRAASKKVTGYAVGVYGSYAVIEEMARRKACTHFWQTYAWSKGKKSACANIYQYKNGTKLPGVNLTLDLNESYGNEGFWEVKPKMKPEDAQKIIAFLGAGWQATESKEARDEFHRLANEVRKAAGIPIEKNA